MPDLATLGSDRTGHRSSRRSRRRPRHQGRDGGDMARRLKSDFASGAISAEQLAAATARLPPALAARRLRQSPHGGDPAHAGGGPAERGRDTAQLAQLDRFQQQATASAVGGAAGYGRPAERALSPWRCRWHPWLHRARRLGPGAEHLRPRTRLRGGLHGVRSHPGVFVNRLVDTQHKAQEAAKALRDIPTEVQIQLNIEMAEGDPMASSTIRGLLQGLRAARRQSGPLGAG